MLGASIIAALAAYALPVVDAVASQTYTWKQVKIGGGGGFVPDIIFNPSQKGLAYARTDIGGAYKLNSDDTWTPLLDFADSTHWNYWGCDALATDPVAPANLYIATGMYTNSWDPNNGQILKSTNSGSSFTAYPLPFKVGGNMPGRGMGERLAVDPNKNSILFFGARSGHGLWKSTDSGQTWAQVTSFTSTGTYIPDPSDSTGYNSDKIGIAWVTFDSTSGTSGTATPRIFVGVASVGTSNVWVSNDAGSTWSAVAGQSTTYMPHKGVLSPKEKVLYISYSNGAGPYDGTLGNVMRYNITSSTWTDITPPTIGGGAPYYGFGGVAIDLQKPGTVMVATLNSWWPDANIWRSLNSGTTWSPIIDWESYPEMYLYYGWDSSLAPWLGGPISNTDVGDKRVGWMVEGMSIDPFDSNHWLYGTGATILGSHDLLRWDTVHNVTLKSLADGVEETSVQKLLSPPTGPELLSAVGDIGGFVHNNFAVAPTSAFLNPSWTTTVDLDYAGNNPSNIVRLGNGDNTTLQVALSTDSGTTWSQDYGAQSGLAGGKIAFSADADTVLWSASTGVLVSRYTAAFSAVSSLPSGSIIASDKLNNSIFYAASGSKFYISTNNGVTFTSPSTLGSSQYPVEIAVNTKTSGDLWVSSDVGLFHSSNFGATFTAASGVTEAWAIALGAPKTTGGYPALFAAAVISGTTGYFRSDDGAVNWVQINDAAHGFGSASSNPVEGDPRIYGRVYIGTNGRGIFYGDASGTAPPPTTTVTTTTASTTSRASTTTHATTTTTVHTTTTTTTAHTTATTVHSTTTTKTSSAAQSTATAGQYGQCGGQGWTGPTACPSGWTCQVQNPYYSQCLQ